VDTFDTLIIGGGIAGLTAAYDLTRAGRRVQLIEGRERLGGLVYTDRANDVSGRGYIIEAGADALLMQKPAAGVLCEELGLRLVPTRTPRTAYVLRHGVLHPLPSDSTLGIPLTDDAISSSGMLSGEGCERVARDLIEPQLNPAPEEDQSVGAMVRRRFGDEFAEVIAQPLLGGIHAGDIDRLSLRALFPALADADAQPGSLIRTLRERRRPPAPDGVFRSVEGGLGQLIAALAARLPHDAIRLNDRAVGIDRGASGAWSVTLSSGVRLQASSLVLAIPAHVVATLIAPHDKVMAELCGGIPYVSTASVSLCYPRGSVSHPLSGTGFVVPRGERLTKLLAVSWVTSKWDARAPGGQIMLRAFAGGVFDEQEVERADEELVRGSHDELAPLLGLGSTPIFSKVYRWRRAGPQYEVGHEARLRAIEARLQSQPGLFLTGSGFRGVGIPDNVADGRRLAVIVDTWLATGSAAKMGDA
jgi:oxygen-dependent protoporphyrinogen oxidase